MRPHGTPKELERRRIRAMAMIKKGMLPVEVARKLGVDRRSVRRWKSAYQIKGIQALKAKPAPGRPRQ
jgi:transposase